MLEARLAIRCNAPAMKPQNGPKVVVRWLNEPSVTCTRLPTAAMHRLTDVIASAPATSASGAATPREPLNNRPFRAQRGICVSNGPLSQSGRERFRL